MEITIKFQSIKSGYQILLYQPVHCDPGGSRPHDFQQQAEIQEGLRMHAIVPNSSTSFPLYKNPHLNMFEKTVTGNENKHSTELRKNSKLWNPSVIWQVELLLVIMLLLNAFFFNRLVQSHQMKDFCQTIFILSYSRMG